jgi:hypothetical protein
MKHLGPIHISYECTPKKLDTFFMYGDTDTPCGIELDTLKQVVASSNFGLLDGVTRVGEI